MKGLNADDLEDNACPSQDKSSFPFIMSFKTVGYINRDSRIAWEGTLKEGINIFEKVTMLDIHKLFIFLTLWNNQKYMAVIFCKIGLKVGVAVTKLDPTMTVKKIGS